MDQTSHEARMKYQTPAMLHRNVTSPPPVASDSADTYFVTPILGDEGRPIAHNMVLDISSGAGVTSFGHSAPGIKDAIVKQVMTMPYAHSGQWTAPIIEDAGRAILVRSGPRFSMGGVTFYSGGSEAVEAALKFGVQILSRDQRHTPILSRRHSYHGNTLGALMVSDHPRCGFVDTAWFPGGYNNQSQNDFRFNAFTPSLVGQPEGIRLHEREAIWSLEGKLKRCYEDFDAKAIVLIETIGGTTLGIEPPTIAYLTGVRSMCDAYDAILIHDEVLSGNYRTGHLLASSRYGLMGDCNVAPDIAVLGKGITGGYFPMSAVVLSSRSRAIMEHCGKIAHTSTNQNHPIGCAAVVAAMDAYDNALPMIRALSKHLETEIMPRLACVKHVHSVSGVGTLWGVRFDPEKDGLHLEVKRQLMAAGISCYTDGNMVDGKGNMLLFAPPCNIHGEDLESFCSAIESLEL